MEFLSSVAQAATIFGTMAAVLVPPVVVVGAAAGRIPRLGPGRAVALALRSRLGSAGTRSSQRDAEVMVLRAMTTTAAADQYCVVVGPKGVGEFAFAPRDAPRHFSVRALIPVAFPFFSHAGKTCIVNTATKRAWGVVRVRVKAGASEGKIVADALRAVTRCHLLTLDQGPGAARVQWFHALLFRAPPTIVLQAAERDAGKDYAEISSSCRALVDFGFRVIVDASHNALSDSATLTEREQVLVVEPMPRELLENLKGLGNLVGALREAGLLDVMWAVVGGNPADYFNLDTAWVRSGRGDVAAVTELFVKEQLGKAIEARDAAVVAHEGFSPLYTLFASADAVPLSTLTDMKLMRPSPDKVLRKVWRDDMLVLVPATQAMAVVLRHKLETKAPSMDALKAMLSKGKMSKLFGARAVKVP